VPCYTSRRSTVCKSNPSSKQDRASEHADKGSPPPSPGQRDKSALLRLCGNMATAMDDLLMGDSVIDDPPTSSSSPAPGAGGAAAIVAAFDASALAEYVADLAVLVLNASRDDLLLSLLAYPDTLHKCSRFAADASSQSLYLRKDTADTTLTPSSQNGIPLTSSLPPFISCCLLSVLCAVG
jgi:hypothetical protein